MDLNHVPRRTNALNRIVFSFLCALALVLPASAQFQGYSSPQGVIAKPFIAANATGPSANIQNIGQTFHTLSYTTAGSVGLLVIRLEGSYDGSTFQAISDDATNNTSGLVVAIGYYPYVRANLVQCTLCGGGNTVTANYSGTSSVSGIPNGNYNPAQLIRKTVFTNQSDGSNATSATIVTPYGSSAGVLVIEPLAGGPFPSSSTITLSTTISALAAPQTPPNIVLNASSATMQAIPMPSSPATTLTIGYTSGGASGNSFNAWYFFYPPGASLPASAQPSGTANSESTSAANAAVQVTLTPTSLQTFYVYSVSGRCSAGTAQLTITAGGAQIWSSGPTEVGTTTFKYQWNPGLAGTTTTSGIPPNSPVVVKLSACGASNTGTLDVQASSF